MDITLSAGASKLLLELYAARNLPTSDELYQELIGQGLAERVGERVELTVKGWTTARQLAESWSEGQRK